MLLMQHERGEPWPKCLCTGIISSLGKENERAEDIDAAYQLAPKPLDTRPVTNLALFVSVWSKCRYDQRIEWREGWMNRHQHGARSQHEIYHVSWRLSLLVERLFEEEEFAGPSLDRRKFCDLLRRNICWGILRDLGLPEAIIVAEESFFKGCVYRFKIGGALSKEFKRTSGFIQGASTSLESALGIMMVMTEAIEQETAARASSFVDDANFITIGAGSEIEILKVWQLSSEFDGLAGTELNATKSKVYCSSRKHSMKLKNIFKDAKDGDKLQHVKSFVIVGAEIHTWGKREQQGDSRDRRLQC